MSTSRENTAQQRLYGAVVPLAKPISLNSELLVEQLQAVADAAGAHIWVHGEASSGKRGLLSSLRGGSTGIRIEMSGIDLHIRSESRPLCNPKAMHSFVNPTLWKSGTSGITGHKGYMMVSEEEKTASETSRDAMFDRATAVTLATAALADLPGAEGAIWLPARNALPISVFGSEMERFLDGQAPLMFWIRAQTIPAPVQAERQLGELSGDVFEPGVATMGLSAFMGSEIVAPPSHCDRDVVLDYLFALASAVIDENANLKDGALLGKGKNQMRLVMRKPGEHSERPYWELEAVNKPAAKPKPARPAVEEPLTSQPQVPQSPAHKQIPPQAPPEMPQQVRQQQVPPAMPQSPGLDAGLGAGLSGGVGRLPSTDKALVDPDDVLKAAMNSSDPLDALPAALRPPRPHPGMSPGGPGMSPPPPDAAGGLSTADAEAALRAAMENPHRSNAGNDATPAAPSMSEPSAPAPSMSVPSMPAPSEPSVPSDATADVDPAAALRRAMLGPSSPDGEIDDAPAARRPTRKAEPSRPEVKKPAKQAAEAPVPQQQLSPEDLEALPAALRPADPTLKPPPLDGGGLGEASREDIDALPAAMRPSESAQKPSEVGESSPAPAEASEIEAIVTDEDLKAKKSKAKAKKAPQKRRPPKRLPTSDDDSGSLGTDIPRPSAEERFDEDPPEPEGKRKDDTSFFDKHLRLVGRR